MIMDAKKLLNNEGQAIFETMLFVPVLLFFVAYIVRVGSAINSSINQQTVTRSYTYYLLKGNSKGNRTSDLEFYSNLDQVGAFMIGYRQKEGTGDTSIAPCFSVPRLPWIPASAETCESASGIAGPDSAYIRVFTFYGVCGENYTRTQGGGTSDFFSSEYPTSTDAPTRGCRFR